MHNYSDDDDDEGAHYCFIFPATVLFATLLFYYLPASFSFCSFPRKRKKMKKKVAVSSSLTVNYS